MQHSFLKKQTHILQFLAIFMLALTCWSCKTEYPSLPYNDIESFSIQDIEELDPQETGTLVILKIPIKSMW